MSYVLEGQQWADPLTVTWALTSFNIANELAGSAAIQYDAINASISSNPQYVSVVQGAFAKWQSVANIHFQQITETAAPASYDDAADIRVGFADLNIAATNEIGLTQYKYIGSSFYQDSLIGLEDPADYAINPTNVVYTSGVTLYQVVLHEIGHALGMGHSTGDTHSVMYPDASAANQDLDATDVAGIQAIYGAPVGASYVVDDTNVGQTFEATGEAYTGGVTWLKSQYIIASDMASINADNLNILTTAPSCFVHSGSGNDAIDVASGNGNNVIDGGTGNNYLTGGSGDDVFFVDDRAVNTAVWDTVVNFHADDQLTMWGINRATSVVVTADNDGAAGATGLTIFASTNRGYTWAAATLAGYTQADLSNGRLTLADGYSQGNQCAYLWIEAH